MSKGEKYTSQYRTILVAALLTFYNILSTHFTTKCWVSTYWCNDLHISFSRTGPHPMECSRFTTFVYGLNMPECCFHHSVSSHLHTCIERICEHRNSRVLQPIASPRNLAAGYRLPSLSQLPVWVWQIYHFLSEFTPLGHVWNMKSFVWDTA